MDIFRRKKFDEAMFAKNRTLAIRVGQYQSSEIIKRLILIMAIPRVIPTSRAELAQVAVKSRSQVLSLHSIS